MLGDSPQAPQRILRSHPVIAVRPRDSKELFAVRQSTYCLAAGGPEASEALPVPPGSRDDNGGYEWGIRENA
eukprot:637733-Hanusia_phi.AAC.1